MPDVIVIGAGISGLCAARLLSQNGVNVTVLEARDRVGGRTCTLKDPSFGYVDVGGAYVGPGQRRIARLAKDLGLEFYKVNTKQKRIMDVEGFRAEFTGMIPPMNNPIKILDVNNITRTINQMASEVPVECPWNAPNAKQWDSMTFQQFIDKTCWTSISREMGRLIIRGVFCVEPYEVSLLFALWYIHSGQYIERLTEIENGAQEQKIVGGAQEISNKMTEALGDNVKLKEPVNSVKEMPGKIRVTTSTDQSYDADYVISAMPQTLLNRIQFSPPLSDKKIQLIQRLPMGSIIKTITYYKKAFWEVKGFRGEMLTNSGPVHYCIDDTKPDGSHPAIMGFVFTDQARALALMSEEERKKAISQHYARVFGCDEFLEPIKYVEKNWMAEEYSGGCYTSTYGPGVLTCYGDQLRQRHGNIFFAGTESATSWIGYMDGAVQAGERAAREVLYDLGKISKDKIYSEEPENLDFPDRPIKSLWIEEKLPTVGQFLMFCASLSAATIAWCINKYGWM